MELLEQTKSLNELTNRLEEQRAKFEQEHLDLEKTSHEAQLQLTQFRTEIEKLKNELETVINFLNLILNHLFLRTFQNARNSLKLIYILQAIWRMKWAKQKNLNKKWLNKTPNTEAIVRNFYNLWYLFDF